jgi:hypothetical protein
MKKILLAITLISPFFLFAQTKVMLGEKVFTASEEIELELYLSIQFIKKSNTSCTVAFIKKSTLCGNSLVERIGGTILFYLEDNTVIKLYDRRQTDCVDKTFYTFYNLTETEMKKIQQSNIFSIRLQNIWLADQSESDTRTIKNEKYRFKNYSEILTNLYK